MTPPGPVVSSARYLAAEERNPIANLCRAGRTMKSIAAEFGRSGSTVSRELVGNTVAEEGECQPIAITAVLTPGDQGKEMTRHIQFTAATDMPSASVTRETLRSVTPTRNQPPASAVVSQITPTRPCTRPMGAQRSLPNSMPGHKARESGKPAHRLVMLLATTNYSICDER